MVELVQSRPVQIFHSLDGWVKIPGRMFYVLAGWVSLPVQMFCVFDGCMSISMQMCACRLHIGDAPANAP
jgi:hypothetical protein